MSLLGLVASIRKNSDYKLGGIAVALGFNTFDTSGLNQATNVATTTGGVTTNAVTVAVGAAIIRAEFEENTAMYSDDTKIGNNRYPEHTLGMKLGGRTQALNDAAKTFDLVRTTWAIKTHTGEYLVLGLSNGLISSQNKSGAGAGTDDFNGFDVVLSGGETAKALIIDATQFNALAARAV